MKGLYMRKKDILELKKRFKKDHCTFTKMCGCYVNGEKNILLKFRETFLNLEEDDYFKYLEIAKKVLSGTIGNNILELNFELNEEHINEKQLSFMKLKNSGLKDDALLDEFYNSIIESYDYTGNFLILIFHDAYDVITKTKDNAKLDESEEVYEYILCAICPVELSKAGLRYFAEANTNGQSNCASSASNSRNNSNTSSTTSSGLASGRSILLMQTMTGSFNSKALRKTNLV